MDKTGRRIIGSADHGCRHCGTVIETASSDGSVIIYRPATDCCIPALLDRIERRNAEISTLRAALDRSESPTTQHLLLEAYEDLDGLRAQLRRMEEAN